MRVDFVFDEGSGREDTYLIKDNIFRVFDGFNSLSRFVDVDGKTGGLIAATITRDVVSKNDKELKELIIEANQKIKEKMINSNIDMTKKSLENFAKKIGFKLDYNYKMELLKKAISTYKQEQNLKNERLNYFLGKIALLILEKGRPISYEELASFAKKSNGHTLKALGELKKSNLIEKTGIILPIKLGREKSTYTITEKGLKKLFYLEGDKKYEITRQNY